MLSNLVSNYRIIVEHLEGKPREKEIVHAAPIEQICDYILILSEYSEVIASKIKRL